MPKANVERISGGSNRQQQISAKVGRVNSATGTRHDNTIIGRSSYSKS
jgi:hypothetical protein